MDSISLTLRDRDQTFLIKVIPDHASRMPETLQTSINVCNRSDGSGSYERELEGVAMINFLTSCGETALKVDKVHDED